MKEIKVVVEEKGEISQFTSKMLADMVKDFFKNPENVRKFEAWQAERKNKEA